MGKPLEGSDREAGHNIPYIFSDEADRFRLETQTRLFSDYVRRNAHTFVGDAVNSILDLGCGEGQLGLVLREVYPNARLVGIDKDEKALGIARSNAKTLRLRNTEFILGDIEQALPGGSFDLVYASTILMHTQRPEGVVQAAYQHLNPGGHLWVKDFDPGVLDLFKTQGFYGGRFYTITKLLTDTIASIGGHPYYVDNLPDWMNKAGFTNVNYHREPTISGGQTEAGRAALAIGLGAFYNARRLISNAQGIPEADLIRMYIDIINLSVVSREDSNSFLANYIAEKPAHAG